jgi:hypothetical protein
MTIQELGLSPILLEELAGLIDIKQEDVEVLDFLPLCSNSLLLEKLTKVAKEFKSLFAG